MPGTMPGRGAVEKFDLGASEAMANTEFSSGIYEAPDLTPEEPPSFGTSRGASLAGDPVDERRLSGSGTVGKGPEGAGETPGQGIAKGGGSEKRDGRFKDTAGARALIL